MSHEFRRSMLFLVIAAFCVATPAAAIAATINVPADQATIQGAIDAAAPGDTILVAPGAYNETLNINQADLEIISTGGRGVTTILDAPGVGNPIVTIAASGATLGLPGQGFTIDHQDISSINTIVINGASIGFPGVDNANPTTIAGNRIVAHDGTTAIYVDAAIAETTLNIQGNVLAMSGGAFSFGTPFYFDFTAVGSVGNASLYGATLRIESNVVNDMYVEAIWIANDVYSSDVVIDNNTFNGIGGAGFGLQCNDSLNDMSTMSFTNNQVTDLDHGFHMRRVESGSALRVSNNTFTNVTDEGVYLEESRYGCDVTIVGNTIVGDGTADYGIRVNLIDDGCTFAINDNDISEVDEAGIYVYDIYYSNVDVNDNTIVGNSATYGIYHYYSDAALVDMQNNAVSGYDNYGLYVDDVIENGGIYRFNGNTFTGDGTGDGMYFSDYFQYGPYVEINSNTITEFDGEGINIDELYEGGVCKVNGNNITAAANTAAATGIAWDYIEDGGGIGTVVGNTVNMNGSGEDGLYFYQLNYGADLLVDNNTVTGYQRYGLYFDDYIEYGASATITNNIFHAHAATGSEYGINISDYVEYGGDVVVSFNDIRDFDDFGIYVDEVYEGSSARIDGNTLSARPNPAQGFGIYVDTVEYGGDTWIRNNMIDVNNAPEDAIYLYYIGYGSRVTITGNTCQDYQNAGLFVDDPVEYGSSLVVNDNIFTPAEGIPSLYGIYLEDDVEYGAYFECLRNNISRFTDYGIRTYYIYDGSDIVCEDNVVAGDSTGADFGIYIDSEIEYGNFFSSISNNTITNIRDDGGNMAGIYVYYLYEGAFLDVHRNEITPHADGASYGIEVEYMEYGSVLDVMLNTISGFTEACIYFDDYIDDGCVVTISNNDLTGADVGVLFNGEIYAGCIINLLRNTVDGFERYGMRFNEYIEGSVVNINHNWFFGGDPGARGLRTFEELDESALLSVNDNCFRGVADGVIIFDIFETAIARLRGNDFSAVSGAAVISVNGDAVHFVDAILNWLDGVGVGGNVDVAPELAAAPDLDGDGVPNCEDFCPNTGAGIAVDAAGCPLPPPPDDNTNGNDNGNTNGNVNDNTITNDNDNGGPGPQPTPDACGCGNGGLLLMPLAMIGLAGIRRRNRNRR